MGLFGYTDRSASVLDELICNPDYPMRPSVADAFVSAYRKPLSVGLERIERGFTQQGVSALQIAAVGGAANLAVVAQAVQAYLSDLRMGKHQGTLVEIAIWAILVSRSSDAAAMDAPLTHYVASNVDSRFPDLWARAFSPQPPPLP